MAVRFGPEGAGQWLRWYWRLVVFGLILVGLVVWAIAS
jgi:hypothetical protein